VWHRIPSRPLWLLSPKRHCGGRAPCGSGAVACSSCPFAGGCYSGGTRGSRLRVSYIASTIRPPLARGRTTRTKAARASLLCSRHHNPSNHLHDCVKCNVWIDARANRLPLYSARSSTGQWQETVNCCRRCTATNTDACVFVARANGHAPTGGHEYPVSPL
jgi:hypothetical protein